MKVFEITPIGVQKAGAMDYDATVEHDILVWINRRGGRCSDDQVLSKLDGNRGATLEVLSNLQKQKLIQRLD